MKTYITLAAAICLFSGVAHAGFDEKVAASFSAKYEVCALRLKGIDGYAFKSIGMKAEADRIHRDKIGGGGYLKALEKEKKKAWVMPIKKCKNIASKF